MLGVDTLSFHVSFLSLMWKLCLLVDFYEFYGLCMMDYIDV
jgi:hypothetical protein